MPVVKKINKIDEKQSLSITMEDDLILDILNSVSNVDIKNAYKAMVQFILWYNENNT